MSQIFPQLGIVILIATAGGFVAKLFKQPLIPFYIIAGLFLGPIFGIITNTSLINGLAEIGIAFLLFLVGVEINFNKLKEVAKFSIITTSIITIFTTLVGFLIAYLIGFSKIEAASLGFVFALSSTSIVLKILTDRKEIDTLPGRILTTILLIQDVFAILFLIFMAGGSLNSANILFLLAKLLAVGLLVFISYYYIVPPIFKFASKSTELLFLAALSICFLFGIVFHYIGLSIAIGAFVGGLIVSSTPYKYEILARISPIRDFFATVFFVSLGLIVSRNLSGLWPTIIILTIFVVLIKPFLILLFTSIAGYKKQTAFTTAVFLGQASEFSLIIIITGFNAKLFSADVLSIAAIVSIISIMISSYLISFNSVIYRRFNKVLDIFEKSTTKEELLHLPPEKELKDHIILFGADRIGHDIAHTLSKMQNTFLVVDYNPTVIANLRENKINCIFGDMTDLEIIERINLDQAKMIVCTVPNFDDNMMILRKTKLLGKHPILYLTAQTIEDALKLYKAGADYVILPQLIGGTHVSHMIQQTENKWEKFLIFKEEHLKKLKKRQKEDQLFI